jgi:hypothetical protein
MERKKMTGYLPFTTKQSQWKNPKETNIQQLFAEWEDDSIRHQELDWGKAEGEELNK